MFWMREEAVTSKTPTRAWKEGVRGSTRCLRILLVLNTGKVQIVCSSEHTRQRKGAQGPLISPLRGLWLTFWVCFHSGRVWHAIWLNDTRVGDHAGLEGECSGREGAAAYPRSARIRTFGGNFLRPQGPEESM